MPVGSPALCGSSLASCEEGVAVPLHEEDKETAPEATHFGASVTWGSFFLKLTLSTITDAGWGVRGDCCLLGRLAGSTRHQAACILSQMPRLPRQPRSATSARAPARLPLVNPISRQPSPRGRTGLLQAPLKPALPGLGPGWDPGSSWPQTLPCTPQSSRKQRIRANGRSWEG